MNKLVSWGKVGKGGFYRAPINRKSLLPKTEIRPEMQRWLVQKTKTGLDAMRRYGETVIDNVNVSKGQKDKDATARPPRSGAESPPIDSMAVGSITRTNYYAENKRRILKATLDALKIAQEVEYIVQQSGYVASAQDAQGISDLSNTPGAEAYNYGSAIWHGDNINYSSSYSQRAGIFDVIRNLYPSGTTTNTSRIFYDRAVSEITFVNAGAYACELTIYELRAKHDLAITNVSSLGTSNNVYSPVEYWASGLSASTAGGFQNSPGGEAYGAITPGTLGAKPWDSQLFACYWDIKYVKKINMTAAAVHVHTSTYKLQQLEDFQRWYYSSLLGGVTTTLMFVVQGTPLADSETNTTIGLGPSKVNWTQNIRYYSKAIPYTQNIVYYGRDYTSYTTSKGVSAIGEDSGRTGNEIIS